MRKPLRLAAHDFMPKKLSAERECELVGELTDWLIARSPGHISERDFRRIIEAFLKGHVVVLRSELVEKG